MPFPGRRRSHPGVGQRERSGWVTSSWNILSPRPYLVLPYRCWPGVSHSTRASDWTPLPWASSSHLPSLSNKQTDKQIPHLPPFQTKGLNLGAPRDRGSPGVRGEAEQTGKRPKRRGSGEATRLIFFFCCARLTVSGCRTGLGPSHKPAWRFVYVCVFKYIKFHRRPGRGGGLGAWQALSASWLVPPLGQEGCWRAAPTQTREGRGRKGPGACRPGLKLPPGPSEAVPPSKAPPDWGSEKPFPGHSGTALAAPGPSPYRSPWAAMPELPAAHLHLNSPWVKSEEAGPREQCLLRPGTPLQLPACPLPRTIGCQVLTPAIGLAARPSSAHARAVAPSGGNCWGRSQAEPESEVSWVCQDCAAHQRGKKKIDCTVARAQGWERPPSLPGDFNDGV